MKAHTVKRSIRTRGHDRHGRSMWRATRQFAAVCASCAAGLSSLAVQAQDFDSVEIRATPIREGLYMLTGKGGNLLVSIGPDGVLLIDDQFAPLAPKILSVIAGLDAGPVRWVVNTHWHGDHTGGNEAMSGQGAVIVAHDNVRERMSTRQFIAAFQQHVEPAPAAALPVVSFSEAMSFYWNGDEARVIHTPAAHTDGDAFVYFRRADVVHAGDVMFSGMYPFFDTSTGGSFDGLIAAVDRLLGLIGDDTLIVPGHGPLSRRIDLLEYRAMLVDVRARVAADMKAGKTRQEIVERQPTRSLDARFGGGFMKPDSFVALVYESLKAANAH